MILMAVISSLIVKLTAHTKPFADGMRRSTGRLKSFRAGIGSVMTGLTGLYGRLAAIVGIGGLGMAIRQQVKYIDTLGHTADRLGMNTEALSKMHYAAKHAGIENKTLEMGFQRMSRRVAEAAKGTGEAVGAIKDMELSARDLAKVAPEEQFLRILGAMEGIESEGEKLRLFFKLFDSEGVALKQLGNVAEVQAMMKEAERFGGVVSKEDVAAVHLMEASIVRLTTSLGAMTRALTMELAPALTIIAEDLAAAMAGMGGETGLVGMAGDVTSVMNRLGRSAEELGFQGADWLLGVEGKRKGLGDIWDEKFFSERIRDVKLIAADKARGDARDRMEAMRQAVTVPAASLQPTGAELIGGVKAQMSIAKHMLGGPDVQKDQLRELQQIKEFGRRWVFGQGNDETVFLEFDTPEGRVGYFP